LGHIVGIFYQNKAFFWQKTTPKTAFLWVESKLPYQQNLAALLVSHGEERVFCFALPQQPTATNLISTHGLFSRCFVLNLFFYNPIALDETTAAATPKSRQSPREAARATLGNRYF
jgi:hypothetical protein